MNPKLLEVSALQTMRELVSIAHEVWDEKNTEISAEELASRICDLNTVLEPFGGLAGVIEKTFARSIGLKLEMERRQNLICKECGATTFFVFPYPFVCPSCNDKLSKAVE